MLTIIINSVWHRDGMGNISPFLIVEILTYKIEPFKHRFKWYPVIIGEDDFGLLRKYSLENSP